MFRSEGNSRGSRRRQAHAQGPAACGVGGRGDGGIAGSPKRDSQGIDPLGGCGQSPPVSPRDGGRNAAASWSVGRCVLPPRRAVRPFLKGKPLRKQLSPATNQNQARQLCSAFAPQGQTASPPHTGSAPCPRGTRQCRPTHAFADGRPLLVGLPPSTSATAPTETKRSAPAPLLVGRARVSPVPTALAGDPAAPLHLRTPKKCMILGMFRHIYTEITHKASTIIHFSFTP